MIESLGMARAPRKEKPLCPICRMPVGRCRAVVAEPVDNRQFVRQPDGDFAWMNLDGVERLDEEKTA